MPRFKVDLDSRERREAHFALFLLPARQRRTLMAAAVTVLYGGELAKDVAARLVEGARTYV